MANPATHPTPIRLRLWVLVVADVGRRRMTTFITIYDFRRDKRQIELMQKASLHRDDCGLVTKPALVGSAEWWEMVGTDVLPIYEIEGKISRVYMSGHNDFPEFEIDDGKAKTRWMRQGDDPAYTVGHPIRLRYVQMAFKRPIKALPPVSSCVITIEVGKEMDSANQASEVTARKLAEPQV